MSKLQLIVVFFIVILFSGCGLVKGTSHLDSTYTCNKKLKGNLMPIIVDYRNEQLVEKVMDSERENIVVLYGLIHIKGMKDLLKKKALF